jgi:hypothetical protein
MNSHDKRSEKNAAFLKNLISFLSDEHRSLEDVKQSLQEQGIDPDNALQEFQDTLATHAPDWREKAWREWQEAKGNNRTDPARPREKILAEIREVAEAMRGLGAPIVVGAHERATKVDLESLLKDLKVQWDLLQRKHERGDE